MPSDTDRSKEASSGASGPGRVWILVGLLAAAAGVAIMMLAGADNGVSESAVSREDSIPLVETARVRAAGDTYEIRAPGRLQAREELQLVGEVSGKVTAINPDLELGGRIGEGDTLLQIDDGDFQADLSRAKAQVSTAEARLEQARAERDRQQRLAEIGAAPDKVAEQAAASFEDARAALEQARSQLVIAQRSVGKSIITAPFDAIVTDENVAPGTFVSPGQPLATLISAGPGEIRASLPAEDVNAVRAALRAAEDGRLPARAVPNSSSLSNTTLEGYVSEFSPVIDQNSRTATVIAVFPDAFTEGHDGDVFSEDFMDVVIRGMSSAPIWQVPAGAVRQDAYVWVVGADEQVRRVEISSIDRSGDTVFVHAPALSGDERVMTTVLAEEIDGMRVHVAETTS